MFNDCERKKSCFFLQKTKKASLYCLVLFLKGCGNFCQASPQLFPSNWVWRWKLQKKSWQQLVFFFAKKKSESQMSCFVLKKVWEPFAKLSLALFTHLILGMEEKKNKKKHVCLFFTHA